MNREPLLFHLMLKQGITWFTLAAGTQENVQTQFSKHMISNILQNFDFFRWHASYNLNATFCTDSSDAIY